MSWKKLLESVSESLNDRIQGALNHPGYTINDQTVGNILKRHGISPAPERKKTVTWREFIRIHMDMLGATDFFNSEVWSWFGLIVSYLLRVVHFGHHQVQLAQMTLHQQMQGIQSLIRFFNVSPEVPIWVRMIQQRSRAIRGGETVPGHMASEVALVDARKPRSQHMGKIVDLSAAHHRQIRDGPVLHRQPLAEQPTDGHRAAA